MPGKITHIPGRNSKKWVNGRINHIPAKKVESRPTAVRLDVIGEKAKVELGAKTEQSIGIVRAREMAAEAGIKPEIFNEALAAGEIVGAEKQGNAWHISPSAVSEWIRSRP